MTEPLQQPIYLIEIYCDYEPPQGEVPTLPEARIMAAIADILHRHQQPPNTGLTFVAADDNTVHEMNLQYRGVDAPTDILSFPADPFPESLALQDAFVDEPYEDDEALEDEGEMPDDDSITHYLGDLIAAYPYTARQAQAAGHDLDDELVLLAIHGTLHLLGYDHDTPENQDRMWAAQADALATAGVAIEVPRFPFDDEQDGDGDDQHDHA